jgi:phosphoribosylformylglycinamidine synthase
MINTILVFNKYCPDYAKVFFFEGFSTQEVEIITSKILHQKHFNVVFKDVLAPKGYDWFCVGYKKRITNPELLSLEKAITDIGISVDNKLLQTATTYLFDSNIEDEKELRDKYINTSIHEVITSIPDTLSIPNVTVKSTEIIRINHTFDDSNIFNRQKEFSQYIDNLEKLSEKRRLFLDSDEMWCIANHFNKQNRNPTDCELEIIAQAWSEHCCHKTFKAKVSIGDIVKPSFMDRIKSSTEKINHPDVLSCFEDNSGVVRFDEEHGIAIKAETHNAPSAIEPIGGAETGVGGVIRDILGTGKGATPLAIFDVLGFAKTDCDDIPEGCIPPDLMKEGVVTGIENYGNKVGLPNISGAVLYHNGYVAKPIVLAGSIGLIPVEKAKKGKPKLGDAMICIGGKTGRDGIHGVTFSSDAMTNETSSTDHAAVQIGYPALKRQLIVMLDKLFKKNIINAITDLGGGGLSSAITEMGEGIGGVVKLENVSTKYHGLSPWEIFLSESQERMLLSVSDSDVNTVVDMCEHYGIVADVVGNFGYGDNMLTIVYNQEVVASLDLDFVLNGGYKDTIFGAYNPSTFLRYNKLQDVKAPLNMIGLQVLRHPRVKSNKDIVRRYDHTVTGNVYSWHYSGENEDTPQNGVVLRPKYNSDKGLIITHGAAPEIGEINPYCGGVVSVIEAIANSVARGGDLSKIFLLDNFIHAKPDSEEEIGSLDALVDGIVDTATCFGTPFVSGKDSLGGTYCDNTRTIKVPPTVIISALSVLDNYEKVVPSYFQQTGNNIVLVGDNSYDLPIGGSVLSEVLNRKFNTISGYNIEQQKNIFESISRMISNGDIVSCNDIKDGGLFTTLIEMSLGNKIGGIINHNTTGYCDELVWLFNEKAGRFLIEVHPEVDLDSYFGDQIPYAMLGKTIHDESIFINKYKVFTSLLGKNYSEWKQNYKPTNKDQYIHRKVSAEVPKPEALIIRAPGTNSEYELERSFNIAGAKSKIISIEDLSSNDFDNAQILGIPGGFSYGDDIYSGKIFAIHLMERFGDSIKKFLLKDKLVIGICNGFQVLVEMDILKGVKLIRNIRDKFICKNVPLYINNSNSIWTSNLSGMEIHLPVAHKDGRLIIEGESKKLHNRGVLLYREDVNGSEGIEYGLGGISDDSGKVLGLMPHPERDIRNFKPDLSKDVIGLDILLGGVNYFKG